MLHLITSFYIIKKEDNSSIKRNNELLMALKYNMGNPNIKKIHLFVDDIDSLNTAINLNIQNKLHVINIGKQPLYSDLFEYTFTNLKNELCMISNSDIYLQQLDLDCINRLEKNVFALSRYEHDFSCPIINNRWGSHDAFIFKSPLSSKILTKLQHVQNVAGSDDSVVNTLVDNGYNLYNPCFQIKIVHLHESNVRTYNQEKIAHGKYFIEQKVF
jgi:hypothetical protein